MTSPIVHLGTEELWAVEQPVNPLATVQCEMPTCRFDLAGDQIALGARLCAMCSDRLAGQIRRLPALFKDCEHALQLRLRHGPERVSGTRSTGIRLNEAAVAVRSDMIDILASWCGMVVEEGQVDGPGQRTVDQLAAFLQAHLDWLVAHPAASDFGTEIADLVAAAGGVGEPDPTLRIELGPCAESGCDRTVWATIRTADESLVHQVNCASGHAWQPHQWLLLGRRIEQARLRLAQPRPERRAASPAAGWVA